MSSPPATLTPAAAAMLGRLDLRAKIGQCFTVGFMDGFLRPDIVQAVRELHCGGLRLVPWEREGAHYVKGEDRCFKGGAILESSGRRIGSALYQTPTQYAELLNRLQTIALERSHGIPLHFALDQEGDSYNDYTRGGVNLFPSNMGLAALSDPASVYRVFHAVGRQLRALGVHMVHSPVLDVNLNPANPEMNFRCFSDDPRVVADLGLQALRGLRDAGVVAVAKHFPGRGDSTLDTHYDFVVYGHDARQMREIDLAPFRALVSGGLRAIMTAHTVYPALGDAERPASVSPTIVHDLLRGEWGFDGVVTTDSITMRGLMDKYGLAEACLMALEASHDLVLYRGAVRELPAVITHIEAAVRSGRLSETTLDEAITRVLLMKHELGLLAQPLVDTTAVEAPLRDPEIVNLSRELPARTALWTKRGRAARITPDTRVLLAEQAGRYAWQCNDGWYHPGMLFEAMLGYATPGRVDVVECTESGANDLPRLRARLDAADAVIATSFYSRTAGHNIDLIRELVSLGKPVVAVTNNPYLCEPLAICDSVLLIFAGNPPGLQATADILYGSALPSGVWPLRHYPDPRGIS